MSKNYVWLLLITETNVMLLGLVIGVMTDYIIQDGVTREGKRVDIEIRNGIIDSIVESGKGHVEAFDPELRYDAGGQLVTPSFVEPHTHLDTALTAGEPHWNKSGTLEEGWSLWTELRPELTLEGIKRRAKKTLQWFISNGVTHVRTHVDVSEPSHKLVNALLEIREEMSNLVEIQIVALPLDSVAHNDELLDLVEDALNRGVDMVGGIPHKENTREAGIEHVERLLLLAKKYDVGVDFHIDESDDPASRYTEILADRVLRYDLSSQATASHITALHSYPNAYADKLMRLIVESELNVITNPMANAVLQGRYDDYPRRRGHTRIKELRDLGVPVALGQDDVMDAFHHYGDGDPLKAAFVLLHYAHMNGYKDVQNIWDMLLVDNPAVYGISNHGIEEGNEGSLVVHSAPDAFNALRTQGPRSLVLKAGNQVAKVERHGTIFDSGKEHNIDWNHHS